ncbi:1498_t:CDS:2 [Ambispora gerdemannii]|uniref:1498_t:CDS:1 n=1 Tax=Ambispora gerdemannii TaxID=144530 RepID=A0A9N8V0Y9_9GLOM|nr:1498_t:CDS:2 [Ambispora gerdemannii]
MSDVSPTQKITLPNGKTLEAHTSLFINNKFVESIDGRRFETINPATEKPIVSIAEGTAADIDVAVDAALEAFEKVWQHVDGKERGRLLYKLTDLMMRDMEELGHLEALDTGKPIQNATGDVEDAADVLRYYAGWADKIHGKVIETSHEKFCYTRHEPIGVVGQIIPWNYPISMLSWKLGPALACGNTIVLKPAEQTPLSALKTAALIREAGFPPGVVNIVPGFGPIAGAAIARHMKITKVAFTGSTTVGKNILKAAADSNLKKVTLELGGKSPNIIFADADLEQAIKWAHNGVFSNTGQNCCAGSRVYVQDTIYDKFLEQYKEFVLSKKIGSQYEPDVYQGPLISKVQFDRIMSYIQAGKDEGANLVLGGDRHGTEGYFVQPTIFTDVNESMKIMQEEIFGPVVAIARFKTVEEVIEKAHLTKYGLAAAVFTKDVTRAIKISNALKAGSVWVNCYNQTDYNAPFGGFKESGHGRELGKYALQNYTEVKTVQINLDMKR